jgi:hypothetical protein
MDRLGTCVLICIPSAADWSGYLAFWRVFLANCIMRAYMRHGDTGLVGIKNLSLLDGYYVHVCIMMMERKRVVYIEGVCIAL